MVTAGIGLDYLARNGERAFAACPCRPKPTCASDAAPVRTNAPARAHERAEPRAAPALRRPDANERRDALPLVDPRAARSHQHARPLPPVAASLVFHLSPPLASRALHHAETAAGGGSLPRL
ncbi:hypothetical protein X992_3387 [Burkholderia pseudomallei MSHR5492]|nr:hypothetical protein X992_3387 [Burkholderia pseudomallei MSHR5492]